MKKVQFDKSCDVQKSEMRRERAIKEAERRARQIQDSDLDDFTRSINGPPFSSPILSNVSCYIITINVMKCIHFRTASHHQDLVSHCVMLTSRRYSTWQVILLF